MSGKTVNALIAMVGILAIACDRVTSIEVVNDSERSVDVTYTAHRADSIALEPHARGRMGGWGEARRSSIYEVTDSASGETLGCLTVKINDAEVGKRFSLRVSDAQPCRQ